LPGLLASSIGLLQLLAPCSGKSNNLESTTTQRVRDSPYCALQFLELADVSLRPRIP
jgi:hypothetical protein